MIYSLSNKSFRNIFLAGMLAIGIALSILLSVLSYYSDEKLLWREFNEDVENRNLAIKREVDTNLHLLMSLQALNYHSEKHDDVSRDEFRNFTNHILTTYEDVQALEWIPRVPASRRAGYESSARREGLENFQFTERTAQGKMKRAGKRKEYFPVYFVEPSKGNAMALGFDLASDPALQEAMDAARKSGEIVASASINLFTELASQFSIVVFAPIYRRWALLDSDQARWDNLQGFDAGVFRISSSVEEAMRSIEPEGLDFFIYDISEHGKEQHLYTHAARNREMPLANRLKPETNISLTKTLDVIGRKWMIIYSATPELIAAGRSLRPLFFLLAGLTVTGLVAGFLFVNARYLASVEKSAQEHAAANTKLLNEIAERRQAEKTIERYNNDLLALADASHVVLTASTAAAKLYKTICEVIAKNFKLKMTWLGLVVKDSYEVKVAGQYPLDDAYMEKVKVTWDDSPTGMGPTGRAIKTKTVQVVDEMEADTRVAFWRAKALKWGFHASLTAPMITSHGEILGALNLYHEEAHFFTPQRKELFQVFANQAATAIDNIRLVEDLEQKVSKRTQEFEIANQQLLMMNEELTLRRSEADTATMQADVANRAKSDFLANMSHELRTPLNAIIGFSDIMINGQAGTLTDEQLDFTRDIGKSGKHLLVLINDILDLSKVEAGKMELELVTVSIQDLIDRSLVMFKEKAMRHHINVDQRVEEGIADIIADEMKLRQVLVNLLSNAFKFTPNGGTVSVAARRVGSVNNSSELGVRSLERENIYAELRTQHSELDGNIDFVEISVADTGPGISPEDIPRLFQPFQQLNTTLTKKVSGTGLGLNLCKKFIELHGGEIWVASEVGTGSTFYFTIPIKKTK